MTDAAPKRASYTGLIVPFALLAAVLVGWTVWWFVVAHGVERGIDRAAADLRSDGWKVSWRERSVGGWPFRTFVQLRDVHLAAPTGQGVDAPEIAAEANTYALRQWVVAAPRGLVFARGERGPVRIEGQAVRASFSGLGRTTPPNVVVQLLKPVFTPEPGAQPFPLASADKVEFYLRPKKGSPGDGEALFRVQAGKGRAGGPLDTIAGGALFNTRWEAGLPKLGAAQGAGWPQIVRAWTAAGGAVMDLHGRIELGRATAEAASPRLTVGPDGRLDGDLQLSLTGAPAAINALGRTQAIDPRAAAAGAAATAALARRRGDAIANLTLSFADGQSRLGPVPLAPAPKVY